MIEVDRQVDGVGDGLRPHQAIQHVAYRGVTGIRVQKTLKDELHFAGGVELHVARQPLINAFQARVGPFTQDHMAANFSFAGLCEDLFRLDDLITQEGLMVDRALQIGRPVGIEEVVPQLKALLHDLAQCRSALILLVKLLGEVRRIFLEHGVLPDGEVSSGAVFFNLSVGFGGDLLLLVGPTVKRVIGGHDAAFIIQQHIFPSFGRHFLDVHAEFIERVADALHVGLCLRAHIALDALDDGIHGLAVGADILRVKGLSQWPADFFDGVAQLGFQVAIHALMLKLLALVVSRRRTAFWGAGGQGLRPGGFRFLDGSALYVGAGIVERFERLFTPHHALYGILPYLRRHGVFVDTGLAEYAVKGLTVLGKLGVVLLDGSTLLSEQLRLVWDNTLCP